MSFCTMLLFFLVIVACVGAFVVGGGHGVAVVSVVALSGEPGEHVALHPLQPSPKPSLDQRPEETDGGAPSSIS